MKAWKRAGILIVMVAGILTVASCKVSITLSSYVFATDFGGNIAIVSRENENLLDPSKSHPYICIDDSGKELFSLPENMIPAYDALNVERMAPVNNYIFATDTKEPLSCKYLLGRSGNIILSPEKNEYDAIFVPKNYRKMFCDGYVLVYKSNHSYDGSQQLLACFDLKGNRVFKPKAVFDYDISQPEYNFLIVPVSNGYDAGEEYDIPFYNLQCELVSTCHLQTKLSGRLDISDYSCGFYRIEKGGEFLNYMDCHGNLLF